MSLLNSLGAFATDLGANAAAASRSPLLNSITPDAPATSNAAAAAATAPTTADAPAAQAKAALSAASSASGVPPDLIPIYQAASKRTGIPVDVLIAQGKQESGFRSDIIGNAGEIGIHQIKPSTAANPGYGVAGIDPKTLTDPATNINFAADYMKAKAGNPNFNDPASVDAALAAYNGGGDPNYVANVRSHMGAS